MTAKFVVGEIVRISLERSRHFEKRGEIVRILEEGGTVLYWVFLDEFKTIDRYNEQRIGVGPYFADELEKALHRRRVTV